MLLEGGYDLDALRLSVGASVAAVLDVEFRPEHCLERRPRGRRRRRGAPGALTDLSRSGDVTPDRGRHPRRPRRQLSARTVRMP